MVRARLGQGMPVCGEGFMEICFLLFLFRGWGWGGSRGGWGGEEVWGGDVPGSALRGGGSQVLHWGGGGVPGSALSARFLCHSFSMMPH